MRRLFYIIPLVLILVSCGMQRTDLFHIAGSKVQVYSYDPYDPNGTLPIPINAKVTVAFNANMDTRSVENAFSIQFEGKTYTAVDGWFKWFAEDRAFIFHYDPDHSGGDDNFENIAITVRINDSAHDSNGYSLGGGHEWTFTPSTIEDNGLPSVIVWNPSSFSEEISDSGYVEIEFDEPMIKSTVALGFVLALTNGGGDERTNEHGNFQWNDDNTKVTYYPDEPLKIGLDYTIWFGFNGVVPCDLANNPLGAVSNGYPSKWGESIRIVVDAAKVPGDVTDFPVYIDLNRMLSADISFFSVVDTDGGDIIIIDNSRKVKLPRELVYFNPGMSEGELWFKAPKLNSSDDTTFYLCYGAPGEDEPNTADVWSNGYIGVYHLDDNYNYYYYDSSPHSNDGTNFAPTGTAGWMGSARLFDGNDDYIELPDVIEDAGTVSMWISPTSWSDDRPVFNASAGPSEFLLDLYSNKLRFRIEDAADTEYVVSSKDISGFSGWHHVTGVWRYKVNMAEILHTPAAQLYCDGTLEKNSPDITGISPPLFTPYIGYPSGSFNGTIDEVHLSNVRRSSGWIATQYNNQKDAGVGGFFKNIALEP